MENKLMRFLSLLLALVMVIALMPVGQVHAAAVIVPEAKVLGDGRIVSLADCEYTFTRSGDYWQITGTTAKGETVYVNPCATDNAVIPQCKNEANLKLHDGTVSGSIQISGENGSLHFHNTETIPWWNKCGSTYGSTTDADHDVYLFKRSAAVTDSVIPGYELVTGLSAVEEGKYLIAAKNTDQQWFVMHPSAVDGTANDQKRDHIAQPITTIRMNVNDTHTITVDGVYSHLTGNDVFDISVNTERRDTNADARITDPTKIENGTYIIWAAREESGNQWNTFHSNPMSANDITSEDGKKKGLELVSEVSEKTYWTITKETEGENANMFTISHNGKYVSIDKTNEVTLSDTKTYVNIVTTDNATYPDALAISSKEGLYLNYFNSFGTNSSTRGAASAWGTGDTGRNDPGGQWYLYKVEEKVSDTKTATLHNGRYMVISAANPGKVLLSTPYTTDDNYLALSSSKELTEASIWTLDGTVRTTAGKTTFEGKIQASNGQCLTFINDNHKKTGLSNEANLFIETGSNYVNSWRIKSENKNDAACLNPRNNGTYVSTWQNDGDNGNHWYLYEIIPVGTTEITFTARTAGDATMTIGAKTYCIHVHTWTDATCVTPKTCSVCGATEGEPLESKNAKPLMVTWRDSNKGVVSLGNCEYVLTGTENGSYSLCHDGTYYVNPAAAVNTGIPQQTSAFAGLSLTFNEGKVKIASSDTQLQVNKVASAVNLPNVHPWWHDSKATQSDSTTDFYLLKANPNSTNTDIPGYEIVTNVTEGESYLIAFENGANEWFVMYPSTETVALAMVVESAGEISIDYTNVSLDNDLKVHFAFEKALIDGLTDCYAVIEKGDETKTIPMGEWTTTNIEGDDYYYVTFDGVAAKEMTDEFTVTIYNAEKQPISTVYTDSVKGYAHRVLNGDYSAEYKTVMVDMLNYGAEAQIAFGYKEDSLANANLTEEQKSAFVDVDLSNVASVPEVTGGIEYVANVKLESNIQFLMAFTGIDPATMTATVTFTDWNDVEHTVTPAFTESGRFHYITIEETVIADGRLPIKCTIKEGDTVIATITDSIASYAARAVVKDAENDDLYMAMMKFSDSSFDYLKSAQVN